MKKDLQKLQGNPIEASIKITYNQPPYGWTMSTLTIHAEPNTILTIHTVYNVGELYYGRLDMRSHYLLTDNSGYAMVYQAAITGNHSLTIIDKQHSTTLTYTVPDTNQ